MLRVNIPSTLEPRYIDEELVEFVTALNDTVVKGMEYLVVQNSEGSRTVLPAHGLVIDEDTD